MFNFFITFPNNWFLSGIFSSFFPQRKDFLSSLGIFLKEKKDVYFPWNHHFFFLKPYHLGFCTFWRLIHYPQEISYYHVQNFMTHYPWPGCIVDDKGSICFINGALGRALGYGAMDLQGQSLHGLFLTPPGVDHFPGKVYTLLGSQNLTLSVTLAHSISLGKYVGIFLFPTDISQDDLGDLHWLSKLPMMAALLDETGTLQMMNHLFKTYLQGGEGVHLSQWIHEKDRHLFLQELKRLRRGEEGLQHTPLSLTLSTANEFGQPSEKGEVFSSFLSFFPSNIGGPGKFLILLIRENQEEGIAEHRQECFLPSLKKKSQNPEDQRMHLLGQVSSGIIHDFNNLLTGMLGFCDLLLQRHPLGDASFKDIDQIRQNALRGARLIQQLLCFSKSLPVAKNHLCLKTCLGDLLPLIHRMLGPRVTIQLQEKKDEQERDMPLGPSQKKKFLSWTFPGEPFGTFGNIGHLEQILLNLSVNARDAMSHGGQLTFSLFHRWLKTPHNVIKNTLKPGHYVVLDVEDTGTGISPELMERIFDPFFSTKGQKGTGIGLCNVLQLMEEWGGGVDMTSILGKGTTFHLYFPQENKKDLQKDNLFLEVQTSFQPLHNHFSNGSEKKSLPFFPQGKSILLVEDEDPVRLFAARALKKHAYEVTEARDGQQALHFLKEKEPFSLMITDVMMPGMDGPTLVTHGRKLFPRLKILFVSGYPEEEVRQYLPQKTHDIFFLQKPFTLDDLVKRVEEIHAK